MAKKRKKEQQVRSNLKLEGEDPWQMIEKKTGDTTKIAEHQF